jgi:hypothetical protein
VNGREKQWEMGKLQMLQASFSNISDKYITPYKVIERYFPVPQSAKIIPFPGGHKKTIFGQYII